jgi:Zn-dependent protease
MKEQQEKSKAGTIFGGLGVLGVLAMKFKFALLALFKFGWLGKSFLSMALSIGIYAMFFGWPYAVAIVLLLFIHEGGHWIWMKVHGLNPQAPIFVPGMGAYVAMTKLPPDAMTRAWVAFAGPLIGGLAAAGMYWGGAQTGNGWLLAAGSTGFFLNLLQLIPAKPLDGGFVVQAISKWLLLPGALILLAAAVVLHSVLLLIIAGIACFSVFKMVTSHGVPSPGEEGIIPATPAQKALIGVAYIALVGMLAYLYVLSQTTVAVAMHSPQSE